MHPINTCFHNHSIQITHRRTNNKTRSNDRRNLMNNKNLLPKNTFYPTGSTRRVTVLTEKWGNWVGEVISFGARIEGLKRPNNWTRAYIMCFTDRFLDRYSEVA